MMTDLVYPLIGGFLSTLMNGRTITRLNKLCLCRKDEHRGVGKL